MQNSKLQLTFNFWRSQTGQTLLELMVVVTISTIIIGALVFATISSLRNTQFSRDQAQATKLAQEAIEKVRTARDRNSPILGGFMVEGAQVDSWQDTDLWRRINGNTCNNAASPPTYCYFKFNSASGAFEYIISARDIPSNPEDPLGNNRFKRVIILSDDASTFASQKTVTVIVRWKDFAGDHDSRLTTVLRRI